MLEKQTLNVIIIDDEQLARRLLEGYVSKVPYVNLLGTYKSPIDALPILKQSKVDVLLLDIRMPDISGLDFLKILEASPAIILTTAYREYALEGYEHNVTDYLLKPIEFSRFLKAINKVTVGSVESPETKKPSEYLSLKYNKKIYRVSTEEILFVKGENEYVKYYLKNGDTLLIYDSLKEIESKLPAPTFCRIHRSYIVNIDHIDYVEGNRAVIGTNKLPISESSKAAFLALWNG